MASKNIITGAIVASVIIILAVVGVLLTSNYGRKALSHSEVNNSEMPAISAEINSPEPSASNVQEPSKALVCDQYSYEEPYSDNVNNSFQISYHVPKINIDSDEADKVNSEIYANCMGNINEELSTMEDGCSPVLVDVSYSTYVYGDVLSIVIEQRLDWDDYIAYQVYNVDIHTGKQLRNSELLGLVNIDQDTFINTARSCVYDRFKGEVQNYKNHVEEVLSLYKDTVNSDNIEINMPVFLDNDGNINIIATIYSVAGDGYEYIINTSLNRNAPIANQDLVLGPLYPQVIEVLTNGSNASITLYNWSDGKWNKEYSCLGSIGKNGITTDKADGDGKTPKGKFALGFAFGLTESETSLTFKKVVPVLSGQMTLTRNITIRGSLTILLIRTGAAVRTLQ